METCLLIEVRRSSLASDRHPAIEEEVVAVAVVEEDLGAEEETDMKEDRRDGWDSKGPGDRDRDSRDRRY